jgi:hypothetical protein
MSVRLSVRAALGALVLLSLCSPLARAACQPGGAQLGTPVTIQVGPSPTGVVAADFDRDGITDLVVSLSHLGYAASGTGEMAFLHGRGDGTFDAPVTFAAGNRPFFLAAGDLNGDGVPDLVVPQLGANNVTVMICDGAGHFSAPLYYPAGSAPHHVTLADFNHDGVLDIIAADNSQASVSVLLGRSTAGVANGTFGATATFPLVVPGIGVTTADVNGDGNLDILATEPSSWAVAVLLGNGSGGVSETRHISLGNVSPYDVIVADLNGDGIPDIVVATQGSGVLVLFGRGDGTFESPRSLWGTGSVNTVRVTDFDGDGYVDLVFSIADLGEVVLLRGNGNAGHNDGTFTLRSVVNIASFPAGLALGDFNGDGQKDIAVGSYQYTTLSVIPGVCTTPAAAFVLGRVRDVPNDQGGKVWLTWNAHVLDVNAGMVTGYRVWRRIPAGAAAQARMAGALRTTASASGPVFWEAAATLPAQRLPAYGYTAATSQDSLASSNPYTAFFITATTADPNVFYDAPVDSGYSVDNLSPSLPSQVSASYAAGVVSLAWSPNAEPDLYGYRVHRGATAFFVPSAANRVGAPTGTSFHEPVTSETYYKVAAVDVHGNVGPFVLVQPGMPVSIDVTLVTSALDPHGATLSWYADPQVVPYANLERDAGDGAWTVVASGAPDGGGWLVLRDASAEPGHVYAYRLAWLTPQGARTSSPVTLAIPPLSLALAGARPNPATSGALALRFSLRDASAATLELFDVNGRRVLSRAVGGLGGGEHVLPLGDAHIPAGLYLARLAQGGEQRRCRVAILP